MTAAIGFPLQVTGCLFIVGAALLWLGWWLLPAKPGEFFVPGPR